MGRIQPVRYRMEMKSARPIKISPMGWHVRSVGQRRGHGAPTTANLSKYIRAYEASTRPGGCNAHLGADTIVWARIVDQETGDVMATYGEYSVIAR